MATVCLTDSSRVAIDPLGAFECCVRAGGSNSETTMKPNRLTTAEELRLTQDTAREKNWKRWGPYLSRAAVGDGARGLFGLGKLLGLFPARSRAQPRVSLGRGRAAGHHAIAQCRLCFALALWNGNDPILKERLFGLTEPEGNHGEDVKECYFYLDSTPTHSYMKALYKYPQAEFPYARLVEENRRRGLGATGVRTDRHGRVRRRPLLRCLRRVRERRGRTTF